LVASLKKIKLKYFQILFFKLFEKLTFGKFLMKPASSGKILSRSGVFEAQLAIAAKVSIKRSSAANKIRKCHKVCPQK
jgi:hypothetical protein